MAPVEDGDGAVAGRLVDPNGDAGVLLSVEEVYGVEVRFLGSVFRV